MTRAFLGPLGIGVDIFAVAKNLAEGGEPPEELLKDPISRRGFIKEVTVRLHGQSCTCDRLNIFLHRLSGIDIRSGKRLVYFI